MDNRFILPGHPNSRQRRAIDDDGEQMTLPNLLNGIDKDEEMGIPSPLKDGELAGIYDYKKNRVRDEVMIVPRPTLKFQNPEKVQKINNDKQMTRIALNTTDGVSVSYKNSNAPESLISIRSNFF